MKTNFNCLINTGNNIKKALTQRIYKNYVSISNELPKDTYEFLSTMTKSVGKQAKRNGFKISFTKGSLGNPEKLAIAAEKSKVKFSYETMLELGENAKTKIIEIVDKVSHEISKFN